MMIIKRQRKILNFFKQSFENFLVDNNPMEIFNKKKLKNLLMKFYNFI